MYSSEMKRQHFLLESYVGRYARRPHDDLLLRWNENAPMALTRRGITLALKRGTRRGAGRTGRDQGPLPPGAALVDHAVLCTSLFLNNRRTGPVVIVQVQAAARPVALSGNSTDHGHGVCDARMAGHQRLGMPARWSGLSGSGARNTRADRGRNWY